MSEPILFKDIPPPEMPKWDCKITISVRLNAPTREHAQIFLENNVSIGLALMAGQPALQLDIKPASDLMIVQAIKESKPN